MRAYKYCILPIYSLDIQTKINLESNLRIQIWQLQVCIVFMLNCALDFMYAIDNAAKEPSSRIYFFFP